MGIDYIIHYDCEPKQALTIEGLMFRLKGRERAQAIIQLYRDQGDLRSPAEMGFEMVRRLPDDSEEVETIVVQNVLDAAAELTPWEPHCTHCPANCAGEAFGCVGTINYPISIHAERWLLDQLPDHDHPLPYILFQKAIHDLGITGAAVVPLRAQQGIFLESPEPLERSLSALTVNGDQLFELLFLPGSIQPAYGTVLLQFFGGISQDLDADTIMQLAAPPSPAWIDDHTPLLYTDDETDDMSIQMLKDYFLAIYSAYKVGVPVLLDV